VFTIQKFETLCYVETFVLLFYPETCSQNIFIIDEYIEIQPNNNYYVVKETMF